MENTIFQFRDYKEYLNQLAKQKPRGFRKELATAMRCQTAYITHVLKGTAHFSAEQSMMLSKVLHHTKEETHYFFLLVQRARAGNQHLIQFFDEQILEILNGKNQLKNIVKVNESLNLSLQSIYYSSWHYAAIHVGVTIP